MLKVGGSNKNSNRSQLIRDMPDWFKPSGNFGIGLQSISLLSDNFTITTKSRISHEALKLTFNLGSGSSIVIESIDHNLVEYGAKVSVDITIDEFPHTISIPWGEDGSILMDKMNDYDFTEKDSNLTIYEQIKIFQAIHNFNQGSPIKISSTQHALSSKREKIFFSREQNICLSNIRFTPNDYNRLTTLFRGQTFSDLNIAAPFVGGKIDFYGYQAIEFLTYSREKILPHIKSDASNSAIKALLEFIRYNFDDIEESDKSYAAAFYYLHASEDTDKKKYESALMSYPVYIEGKGNLSLDEIIKKIKEREIDTIEIHMENYANGKPTDTPKISPQNVAVLIKHASKTNLNLIKLLATKQGLYWQEQTPTEPCKEKCYWSDQDIIPIDKTTLRKIMSGSLGGFNIGKRMTFPAWGDYRKLSITANISWANSKNHLSDKSDMLVLPYAFHHNNPAQSDKSNSLIEWVYSHRTHQEISIDMISSLYDELIREIDEICIV